MGGPGQGAGALRFGVRAGAVEIVAPGAEVALRGLRPEVHHERGGADAVWRPAVEPAADGCQAETAAHGLRLRLRAAPHAGGVLVRASLTNTGATPVRVGRIAVLATRPDADVRVGARADQWSVYRQGYQSWTGTRSFRSDEADPDPFPGILAISLVDIARPADGRPGHFRADMFAAIENRRSGEALVAGFLTCRRMFGTVEVAVTGRRCARLAAVAEGDGVPLAPGASMETEPLWVGVAAGAWAGLCAYADAVGAAMEARVPARAPVGWCSWYHYFTRVSEAAVLENLRALATLRPTVRFDYVQVDDGYQRTVGEWLTANPRFPRGMGSVAEQIDQAGFTPGIWIAPFIARRGARILREHPDWFVQTDAGRPRRALWNPAWGLGGICYALDTTHPGAQEWLRNVVHTLVHFWGFRVLKLDFLFAAALPGRRHDPAATRAAALRRGLEIIRATAGDDVFLIGCGCPLGPAIGVVDAMRIGPDVAPWWSRWLSRVPQRDLHGLATRHAVRNILTRAVLHRRWWLNDPDCLMVREADTALSLDEVLTLATAIAVTDGMVVLGDRLDAVPPERLAILRRTLAARGGRPEVIDLMACDPPTLVVSRAPDRTLLAVFNFADEPARRRLVPAAVAPDLAGVSEATDWWTGERLAVQGGVLDLGEIPAHGARLLAMGGGGA